MKILNYTLTGVAVALTAIACSKKNFQADPGKTATTTSPTVSQKVDSENTNVRIGIPTEDGVQYYDGSVKKKCGCGTKGRGYSFEHVNKKYPNVDVIQYDNGQLIVRDGTNRRFIYAQDGGSYKMIRSHKQIDTYCKKNKISITDYIASYANWAVDIGKKSYDYVSDGVTYFEDGYCKSNKCGTGYKSEYTGCSRPDKSCFRRCYTLCGKTYCTNNTTNEDYTYMDDLKERLERGNYKDPNKYAEDFWEYQNKYFGMGGG